MPKQMKSRIERLRTTLTATALLLAVSLVGLTGYRLVRDRNQRFEYFPLNEQVQFFEPTDGLVSLMKHANPRVRYEAAFALANYGSREISASDILRRVGEPIVPHLIRALSDPSPRIRAGAAQTLGDFGATAERAVPHLIAALRSASSEDSRQDCRHFYIRALGKIGPPARISVPLLRTVLQTEWAREVKQFRTAKQHPLSVYLSDHCHDALCALDAIAPGDVQTIAMLAEFIADDDIALHLPIVPWCDRADSLPVVKALVDRMNDTDPTLRKRAADTIGFTWPERGIRGVRGKATLVPAIADLLSGVTEHPSPDDSVIRACAVLIGDIGRSAKSLQPRLGELFDAMDPVEDAELKLKLAVAIVSADPHNVAARRYLIEGLIYCNSNHYAHVQAAQRLGEADPEWVRIALAASLNSSLVPL